MPAGNPGGHHIANAGSRPNRNVPIPSLSAKISHGSGSGGGGFSGDMIDKVVNVQHIAAGKNPRLIGGEIFVDDRAKADGMQADAGL